MAVHPDGELLPLLKASEQQFLAVVDNIPGAVYRCACDFIGNAVRSYGSIIHPDDRPYVAREIESALDRGAPYCLQYRVLHAAGGERWVSERGRTILGEDGERLWLDGVILDVTDQVLAAQDRDRAEAALRQQAELNRHQALHDALTGLPNRVLFQDRLGAAIRDADRRGTTLAVLVMDLDRFKEINDTLGHASGDRFLVEAATRLQATMRGSDSIARLGGDEFAIVLPDSGPEAVAAVARRIREAFDEPVTLHGLPLQMEASIGAALYPAHGRDVEGLIRRADVAMYIAKNDVCGWALYDQARDRNELARLSLISELRRAIDERELVLHYQPKISLRGGRVHGVEALARWQHPTRGLLGPDEFIDVTQGTSLIRPFTLYVIDEALRQCRQWATGGRALAVAVNVSTRNLIDVEFPDQVGALLDKWGVSPDLLELEITESAIVSDMFRMKSVLERLGGLGLRLSVDDFGTGYTSLGYLRRLPINELKIDRSFVANLTSSDEDAVIVRSTIDLGRNLGLDVVAEGVEDLDVLRRLGELGCDVAQGFLMSRPVPAGELTAWLDGLEAPGQQPGWRGPLLDPAAPPAGPLAPNAAPAPAGHHGSAAAAARDEQAIAGRLASLAHGLGRWLTADALRPRPLPPGASPR
jgi:diguanylate cyclase (GGDEF)-like protein